MSHLHDEGLRSRDDLTPARVLGYTRWQGVSNWLDRTPPRGQAARIGRFTSKHVAGKGDGSRRESAHGLTLTLIEALGSRW